MPNESKEKANDLLFESIASDLCAKGYSVCLKAIPFDLSHALKLQALNRSNGFNQAGVGRQSQHMIDDAIRSDKIAWINDD
ncbi:MAG: 2OG-Fe(II) oxygenase, partial [Pseudomonadota bacterium]